MEDKEFKEKLSKISNWYIPIVRDGSSLGTYGKPMPTSCINQTINPIIEKMHAQLRPCEWCHKICDQKQNHTLKIDEKSGKREWTHTCQTCRRIWDPNLKQLKALTKKKPTVAKKKWWNE